LTAERLIARKIREDLGESNLVNEGLQSQHKLMEHKLKSISLELEEETKRREAAEKRAGINHSTAGSTESFQVIHTQLTEKMKSMKVQEKLQQESLLATNDRNEANHKVTLLAEEIKKKDSLIQTQALKFKLSEEEMEKLKSEITKLTDSNVLLKKKVQTLLEHSTQPHDQESHNAAVSSDHQLQAAVVQKENRVLRERLTEQEERFKLTTDQMDKTYRDMQVVLQQEIASLKEEKRSLLLRVKSLMERRSEQQIPVIPILPSLPAKPADNPPGFPPMDSNRTNNRMDDPGMQFGIDLRSKEPYYRDINDTVSEPSPNRRSTITRRRDGSAIEEIVERINNKQNSRSNSPAAVARYIAGGDQASEAAYWIERARPNSMLAGQQRATANWGVPPPANLSPQFGWMNTQPPRQFVHELQQMQQQGEQVAAGDYQVYQDSGETIQHRQGGAVTVSSDLGRTELRSTVGQNILSMFQRAPNSEQ
jgi:hypothetical protein